MNHPDDATIERFAIGALEDDAAFVAHVAGCDDCSRKLQREASLELSLLEAQATRRDEPAPDAATAAPAAEPRPRAPLWRIRRPLVAAGLSALAAAAGVLLYLGYLGREARLEAEHAAASVAPVRVVSCPDGPQQARCIAKANLEGSYVEYPKDPLLLGLGATPGLTISLSVIGTPNPPLPELEQVALGLREPIKQCIAEQLGATAKTTMGVFSFSSVVEDDGTIITPARLRSALKKRATSEIPTTIRATLPCISRAMRKATFAPNGKRTLIEIGVRYVWRE